MFKFNNLTEETRQFMEDEVREDIKNGTLYYGKYLSQRGKQLYPDLLIKSIKTGNESTLAQSLVGLFDEYTYKNNRSGVASLAKVPCNANLTLAEGEFNRFYIRALCRIAMVSGRKLRIYRAKMSLNPRPESQMKIGAFIDANKLLSDLRSNQGTDTALGLPPGPNSGLSVELV